MIELTVVSLTLILLLAYFTMGRNLSRPTILYVGGFLICSVVAWSWKDEWGLETMSSVTAFMIIGGAIVFYFVEWVDYTRSDSYAKLHQYNDASDVGFEPVSSFKLLIFLLFQIFAFVLVARSKMEYAMTDDLAGAIGQINDETKFQETILKLPFYVGFFNNVCTAAMPIWCSMLPFYMRRFSQCRLQTFLISLNLITLTLGMFLGGGRTYFLNIILTLVSFAYINYQYKNGWTGGLFPKKVMVAIMSFALVFILLFSELGTSLGRKESNKTVSLIFAMYCGAEIKNLDDYVQMPFDQDNDSGRFLQYTFCGIYDKIDQRLYGSEIGRANYPDLAFNNYDGFPLGNVYTTYYNFFVDWGAFGAVLLAGFISLITAFFYRKTVTSEFWCNGQMNIWMLWYGSYMPQACFLSFFANKMFESITLFAIIRNLILWSALILFFNGKFRAFWSEAYETKNNLRTDCLEQHERIHGKVN